MSSPDCPPVWQYLLIMGEELHGLANGMKAIGEFHAQANGKALEPLAHAADKAVEDIREELEKLTTWHP